LAKGNTETSSSSAPLNLASAIDAGLILFCRFPKLDGRILLEHCVPPVKPRRIAATFWLKIVILAIDKEYGKEQLEDHPIGYSGLCCLHFSRCPAPCLHIHRLNQSFVNMLSSDL